MNNKRIHTSAFQHPLDVHPSAKKRKIEYNPETTKQLAKRLQVPYYVHKRVYHRVQWRKYVEHTSNNSHQINVNTIERNRDIFTVNNLLSPKECKTLIYLSESHGYCSLGKALAGSTFRTNTRVITDDVSLSVLMYERLKCFLPDIYRINGEDWKICGINARFRFCKYENDQEFKIHHDGRNHVRNENKSSLYTVNIYLNDGNGDGFDGGRTIFFRRNSEYNRRNRNIVPKWTESSSVTAVCGSALVFNHFPSHYKHCGEKVRNGRKYILRTDVMYERQSA